MDETPLGTLHEIDESGLEEFISTEDGLLNIIEQFRGGAKYRLEYELIKSYLKCLINSAGPIYQVYNLPSDLELVRIRPCNYTRGMKIERRDFGPPPADLVDKYGRCNKPNQSVFYTALHEDIALMEVKAFKGQHYFVSTHRLDKSALILPVGELDYFRRSEDLYLGGHTEGASDVYRNVMKSGDLRPLIIDAFIADEFIKSSDRNTDYVITCAASEIYLDELSPHSPPDALLYPSVAFRGGANLALSRGAYEKKTKLESAKIVQVTDDLGFGIYRLNIIEEIDIGQL